MRTLLLAACALSLATGSPEAANRSARVSGNWNQNIWSNSNSCGGAIGASIPGAADDAFICNGVTVTLDASRTVDSVTIRSGGTLNGSSHTLSIDNTVAFTLDAGGTFDPQSGTVRLIRNGATTAFSGTAAAIAFNNLTIDPALGGNRTYTLSAGSIRGITVTGDFNITPPSAGGTRTLTVNDGVLSNAGGGLAVGGTLTLDAGGNELVTFNTGGINMSFGRVVLGGAGSGNQTFAAGASTVTLNGASGPLIARSGNGVFTDGTSTVVMNAPASVSLTAGDFTGGNRFNNLTVSMPGLTGTLGGEVRVNSTLLVSAGTLDNGGFDITGGGGGSSLQVNDAAGFSMSGTAAFPPTGGGFSFGSFTFQPASTVRYLQSNAQAISPQTYGHLQVAPSANGVAHEFPAGTVTLAGNLTVGNGINTGTATAVVNATTLDIDGGVSIAANATLVANTGNSMAVHGDWANAGAFDANGGSVTLDGIAPQSIAGPSVTVFEDLTLNNTIDVVSAVADFVVAGTLVLNTGTRLADGGQVITVRGDIDNSGAHSGSGRIALSGGAAEHQLSGGGTYGSLELDDAFGATISADVAVTGTLMLTSGTLNTGAYTLATLADCPGSVTRTSGWVAGELRMGFPSAGPPDCTFHLGDPVINYAPLRLAFSAITTPGSLTASVENSDHPNTIAGVSGISVDESINRYWTLKDSTVEGVFTATFTYVDSGDHDAGVTPAAFRIRRGEGCEGDASSRTCTPWLPLAPNGVPDGTQASVGGVAIAADGAAVDFVLGESDPSTNFQRERQFIYTRELY